MRFLPFSHDTLLLELDNLHDTLALLQSLQTEPITGVIELTPAARTILLRFAPHKVSRECLQDNIARRDWRHVGALPERGTILEIPVFYDGEDLAHVAQLLNLSAAELIERHTQCEWFVAFIGFAPGFAYLAGGDPIFNVPRRTTPRTKVPAGSVALAGTFCAIYPRVSPGGWQLIGTSPVPLWDERRSSPALLQAGQRLRFVNAARQAVVASTPRPSATVPAQEPRSACALCVQRPGILTLVQDLGRPGLQAQGVGASGAMDQAALRCANRLVGNASDTGALETLGAGLVLQSRGDTVVAVTGADARLTLSTPQGQQWRVPSYQALALANGDCLTIDAIQAGLRSYIAVRGGFACAPVLGSVAADTLSHLGPAPLAAGQCLAVRAQIPDTAVALPEHPPQTLPQSGGEVVLDIWPGPRVDWFTAQAQQLLERQRWHVTPQSNRVGLRLTGTQALARTAATHGLELPSEGLVCGAVQIPPSGQPVLFLRDHPTTGGYPVIACVAAHHLDLAGQIPVGTHIRFRFLTHPS